MGGGKKRTKHEEEDAGVLEALLGGGGGSGGGGGVRQVVSHDFVERASVSQPERVLWRKEEQAFVGRVREVAAAHAQGAAVEPVRRTTPVNVPTWTGVRGVAGAPPSSEDLVQALRGRRRGGGGSGSGSASAVASDDPRLRLALELRDMLNRDPRKRAATQTIVDAFDARIATDEEKSLFRAALKELAELRKGFWVLRGEYRL